MHDVVVSHKRRDVNWGQAGLKGEEAHGERGKSGERVKTVEELFRVSPLSHVRITHDTRTSKHNLKLESGDFGGIPRHTHTHTPL